MPLVEVDEIMPAPAETIWELINDVEAYTRLMQHVRSVEVLETGPNFRRLAWEVELKGCIMRWIEYEESDPDRYRIDYHQTEGDLAEFSGYWQLYPLTDGSCRAVMAVNFDIGMPMLSEMMNPVAEHAIRENSRSMLASLASHAAQRVS